jgi:hypothetical protein
MFIWDVSVETEKRTLVFAKRLSSTFGNVYIVKYRALVIPVQWKLKNTSKISFNFLCCRADQTRLKKIKIFLHVKQDCFPVLSHLKKISKGEGKYSSEYMYSLFGNVMNINLVIKIK